MSDQPASIIYQGARFRSLLEARWAVFFDTLNVPWEYARQEYNLPYGGPCTPNFWLPVQRSWVEVKPKLPTEAELIKAADLSFATRSWVYVIWGEIGQHRIYAFNLPFYDQGYDKRFVFMIVDDPEELVIGSPLRGNDEYQFIGYCNTVQRAVMQKAEEVTSHPRLTAAYAAALRARFEQAQQA